MFSYVCFARLQASMTWDVLDMSCDFWIAGVKGLLQVRTNVLMTPLCEHSYSNTFCSHCTPFGQRWKLSFNSSAALQCLVLSLCKYSDGTTKREIVPISWDFSKDIEQSTALLWYGGLSLLLPSPAWKAGVALGLWKWAEGDQVS